jgi:long-chain acyl-CoA synthetase
MIGERFRQISCDKAGDVAVCTIPEGIAVSFAHIAQQSARLERALSDVGVAPGAAVVSLVGNRPHFFSLFVACAEVGAALVPLGETTDAEALSVIVQSDAVAVVSNRPLSLDTSRSIDLDGEVSVYGLRSPHQQRAYPPSSVLKLTSGSTELPKAAVASDLHLVNDGRHIIEAMGIGPDDVNYACTPLSHSYALGNVVMPLLWQGTRTALRQSFNPSQFLHEAAACGATVFPGVPFMFERIRSLSDVRQLPDSLRLLITAGARIDLATVDWFRQRLDRKVHSFYGSSETGGISYDDSEDVRDPLDVGRPMPETVVRVSTDPEAASSGRLLVTGNAVSIGYASVEPVVSGFRRDGFLTSDLGYLDSAGRVVLTGRVSPLMNVSGRKVDPAEVERALLELPGIAAARVLGVASETRGQEVVAFLVRTDEAMTPLVIRQRCAAQLSSYKIPRRFVFLEHFPVDARGKVDRQALQRLAVPPAAD